MTWPVLVLVALSVPAAEAVVVSLLNRRGCAKCPVRKSSRKPPWAVR